MVFESGAITKACENIVFYLIWDEIIPLTPNWATGRTSRSFNIHDLCHGRVITLITLTQYSPTL